MIFEKHTYPSGIGPEQTPLRGKKLSILVGICSCDNAYQRRAACHETWLSYQQPGFECRFFLGLDTPPAPDAADALVIGYSHLAATNPLLAPMFAKRQYNKTTPLLPPRALTSSAE